jgi:two-component system LytT family response regulator
MRVLLVDDEALALDRLRTFFADIEAWKWSARPRTATRRWSEIAELTPDLVIMDVQMPGRNGPARRRRHRGRSAPEIVFVTAHEHYAPDAFDVDAADYLLKPVRLAARSRAARRRRAPAWSTSGR